MSKTTGPSTLFQIIFLKCNWINVQKYMSVDTHLNDYIICSYGRLKGENN